jgi:hypothetical protein
MTADRHIYGGAKVAELARTARGGAGAELPAVSPQFLRSQAERKRREAAAQRRHIPKAEGNTTAYIPAWTAKRVKTLEAEAAALEARAAEIERNGHEQPDRDGTA